MQTMQGLGGIIYILYLVCMLGVIVFLLQLAWRFVRAHERVADALEVLARKPRDGVGG